MVIVIIIIIVIITIITIIIIIVIIIIIIIVIIIIVIIIVNSLPRVLFPLENVNLNQRCLRVPENLFQLLIGILSSAPVCGSLITFVFLCNVFLPSSHELRECSC